MRMKGKIGAIILAVLLIVGLGCVFSLITKVPTGYVGVVYNMSNGVAGETISQGIHVVSPTKEVTLYPIGLNVSYLTSTFDGDSPDDDSFEVPTSDGKGLTVDLTFTYRFDADTITQTFTRFKGQSGKDVLSSFIKPNVMSWTKELTAMYPVTDILGDKRASMNTELGNYLAEKFAPYGIVIENASLINIDPDEATRQAIQKKVTAQQEMELASIQAKTAKIDADKQKEVALIEAQQEKEAAEIEADMKRISAQGDADAIKIRAEAEAEANKVIAESLTGELLEKQKIDKWNGDVPRVSGGTSASIIDISDMVEE